MRDASSRGLSPTVKRLGAAVARKGRQLWKGETYPADFDDQTVRIVEAVKAYTMTSPERVYALVQAVKYLVQSNVEGCFVECGVWRGGSTMAMALTLSELDRTDRDLYLFDTFAGMSAPTADDVSHKGELADRTYAKRKTAPNQSTWCLSPLQEVRRNVERTGYPQSRFHFVEGKVEETLPARAPAAPIALLRLDTDWYESTKHELTHLFPRLAKNGVLIVDDYGHWAGAKKAVDEYIAEKKLNLLLNRIDYTGRIAINSDHEAPRR